MLLVWPIPAPAEGFVFQGGLSTQKGSPTGTQNVLTIFVRASDDSTGTLGALRTSEQTEFVDVANFYDESSFGQLAFNHTLSPQTGWHQLSKTYDDYIWTPADMAAHSVGSAAYKAAQKKQNLTEDFLGLATEAMQAAVDDGHTISNFDQVVIVLIGPFLRGESAWPHTYKLKDAANKDFMVKTSVLVVSTQTNWSRLAHEYGHAFGHFPDAYYSSTRRPGNWEIMDCTDCGAQTTGWNKEVPAGWFKDQSHAGKILSLARPTGQAQETGSVTLVPYEMQNPPVGSRQSFRLDVGGGLHLYVENRQTLSGQTGSQSLPGSGIIITDAIDDTKNVNVKRDPVQLYAGPLGPGTTWRDTAYGDLSLQVTGTAPNLTVNYSWGPDPYADLSISPWYAPPWESPDIWIDNPLNGWNTYEHSDASQNPSVPGHPIRNGDRPHVNGENRLYARVKNEGTQSLSNVKVSFFVTEPQGIGQQDTTWSLIDKVTIPNINGGASVNTPPVTFVPRASQHTCLRVVVEHQAGELNANNNEAFENISDFNTTSTSPWVPIASSLEVGNPTDQYKDVILEMHGLPDGWMGWISRRVLRLGPGETQIVRYRVDPGRGGGMDLGTSVDVGIVGYIRREHNFYPIGGVTSAIHLVEASSIALDVSTSVSGTNFEDLPVFVSYEPRASVTPLAFEIVQGRGRRRAIFSTMTDGAGSMRFSLGDIVRGSNLPVPSVGETFTIQALLYGDNRTDAAKSREMEIKVSR